MPKKAPGKFYRQGISLEELIDRFPDEASARMWFEEIRWPNGRTCPHCASTETNPVPNENPMPYHCKACRQYFSVKTGTVMASSNLKLRKWVIGFYLMSTNLKGVSSMKLHRDLKITQKTAWMMAQKIRQAWTPDQTAMLGPVEVDETWIGGKDKNKHANKKTQRGNAYGVKQAVVGMKSRTTNQIAAQPIDPVSATTLQRFVTTKTDRTQVYSDQHRGYWGLRKQGYHLEQVNHSAGEYVRDMAHTNGIESFWALLKRGYHGTFHKMSVKHLHRYVNEFSGRHNIREEDTIAQMSLIAQGLIGKQLPYKDLVA